MSHFDDLLDRVTDRLKVDPELRAEVRHELEAHLEDSTKEFRAAGMSEDDAAKKAMESFGDETLVAQQLWDANRKKIPTRKILRAAGQYALAPAVAIVSIGAGWAAISSLAVVLTIAATTGSIARLGANVQPARKIADANRARTLAKLSPDQLLAFQGNPDAATRELRVKPIIDRWPDDKMYFAEYANNVLMNAKLTAGPEKTDRAELDRALAIMDRGEQLDPDNGFYPLLKSALLFDASSETTELEDNDPKQLSFEFPNPLKPESQRRRFDDLKIADPVMFDRAIAEFHKAASKPFIESYAIPLANRRLAMLPLPKSLGEQLMRTMFAYEVLLPNLSHYRNTQRCVGLYALTRAQAGDGESALKLVGETRRMAVATGATSHVLVELLVSWSMYTSADAHDAMIYKLLGKTEDFERARQRLTEHNQEKFTLLNLRAVEGNVSMRQRAGLAESTLVDNATVWKEPDLRPGRLVEYAVADQIAVAMFVLALILPLALRWIVGQLKRWRGEATPISVFVGWKRLLKILLLGVVAPLIGYAVYVRLFHAREFGIGITFGRMLVEYAALACVMTVFLRILSDRAMRARARELGLPAPAALDPSGGMLVIGSALALLIISYIIWWEHAAAAIKDVSAVLAAPSWLLAGLILFYALAWTRPPAPKRQADADHSWLTRRIPDWILITLLVFPVAVLGWLSVQMNRSAAVHGWREYVPLICVGLVIAVSGVLLWNLFRRMSAPTTEMRPLFRSALPIPAAAALALLLTAGVGARVTEKRIVSQHDRGAVDFTHEIDRSTLAPLQQQFIAELAKKN